MEMKYTFMFTTDFSSPRSLGVDGFPLPSPRLISNHLHRPGAQNRTDTQATVMVMAFGQFFDHDLMFTPMTKGTLWLFFFSMQKFRDIRVFIACRRIPLQLHINYID